MRNMRIAELLFNRPLMISEAKLNTILHVLGPRLELNLDGMPAIQTAAMSDSDRARAGYQVKNGIASIGLYGPLLNRVLASEFPSGGPTSYSDIRTSFDAALADDSVQEIKMEIDSPGGDVSGCFDLADHIYESRGLKPITAVVNENAFSAAYLLASAAGKICVPRTGNLGSIGVIMTHADFSRAENSSGITVTHIIAGARKADFSSHQPISADALQSGQSMVDETYALFVQTVARNRGISEDAVRGTEAGIFKAKAAVAMGFADEIIPADKALASLCKPKGATAEQNNSNYTAMGGTASAETTKEESRMTKAELKEKYPALFADVFNEGQQAGIVNGAESERTRIQSVLSIPGPLAAAHKDLITQMAFDGKSTAETAVFRIHTAAEENRITMAAAIKTGAVQAAPDAEAGSASDEEKAISSSVDQMVAGAAAFQSRQ